MSRPTASWAPPTTDPERSPERRAANYERRLRLAEAQEDSGVLRGLQGEYDRFLVAWLAQDELRDLVPKSLPLTTSAEVEPETREAIRERLRSCHGTRLDLGEDPLLFASAMCSIGEYGAALEELESLPRGVVDGAGLEVHKGLCLARLERWFEALRSFERAVELDPRSPSALSGKGLAVEHLGRPEEALVHYGRSLALDPLVAETHFRVGECLSRLGRSPMALMAFERAVALAPENKLFREQRARILLHEGKLDAALRAYDELELGSVAITPPGPKASSANEDPGATRSRQRSRRKRRRLFISVGSVALGLVSGWVLSSMAKSRVATGRSIRADVETEATQETGRAAPFVALED